MKCIFCEGEVAIDVKDDQVALFCKSCEHYQDEPGQTAVLMNRLLNQLPGNLQDLYGFLALEELKARNDGR